MDLGSGKFNLWLIQPQVEGLKLNKKKAASPKLQASSLTVTEG